MARFSTSSYTFDKSNLNYINAIATYNKNVHIKKINGRNVSEQGYGGKDLPSILPTIRAEELNIECVSGDSASTVGAFPVIDKDKLLSAISDVLTEKEQAVAAENSAKIEGYFQELIQKGSFDIYYSPPEGLAPLNQSQAILVLDRIQKKFEVTGAMLFPQHEAILLQFNHDNYLLRYGNKTSLKEMARIVLDIDDGFCSSRYDLEGKEMDKTIHDELQAYFQKWKANNYQGVLISANQSGFKYGQSPVAVNSMPAPNPIQKEPSAPVQPAQPVRTNTNADKMRRELETQEAFLAQIQSFGSDVNFFAPAAASVATASAKDTVAAASAKDTKEEKGPQLGLGKN